MAADDVQLPDLEVIQRYSLAVRGATAPRADVIAALQADLDWLTSSAPSPSRMPMSKGSTSAPAKAPVKRTAATPPAKTATSAPAPPKRSARRTPVKRSTPAPTSEA